METYRTLQKVIAGNTVEHARALGVSTSLVNKWQEPHTDFTDSGVNNPIDRLETMIDTAIRLGITRRDYLAPVFRLNHKYGLVSFDMPDIGKEDAVASELIKTIKEFSDMVQATSDALSDNRIDRNERAVIIREGEEALRAIGTLIGVVRELAQ